MQQAQMANITYDVSKVKVIPSTDFQEHLKIYQKHVENYNSGKGDIPFEKAGAHLHKLFFENIRESRLDNTPMGKVADILETRYGNSDNFYKCYMDTVDRLQGSGWVFMNTAGYLNIIPNNRIVDNIAFIIDFWEHAYYPRYSSMKKIYAKEALSIINWDVVNKRILQANEKKKEKHL